MIVESIAKDRGQKGEGMMMQIKLLMSFNCRSNDVYALVRTVPSLIGFFPVNFTEERGFPSKPSFEHSAFE